ncbi:MAG: substrate-binding domain-containing protein [Planctomycetes bacterium]|nr:substrate-binding domain-containing protein [Planctomycetota bacterium]
MKPRRWLALCVAVALTLAHSAGCNRSAKTANTITLATTTSTQDTGLLDFLAPKFREQTGIEVQVVAVGSGQAMELGRRGDADVLLTHAPAAEQKFMDEGWGHERRPVMYNDFVLVGPKSDPAMIGKQSTVIEAFSRLVDQEAPFVSRGDDSGTHQREIEIWGLAGHHRRDGRAESSEQKVPVPLSAPTGDWYIHAGTGMAQALRMANEKRAYTLTDRGTFLALRKELDLQIVFEGDPFLKNNYSVIVCSSQKHPHLNTQAAEQFANFLTDPTTQQLIANFGVNKFDEPLFYPTKSPTPAESSSGP